MEKNERLKAARVAAGYKTAVDAAAALGVKGPTYSGHENGSRDFSNEDAALYARRFRVSLAWLAMGKGEMYPSKSAAAEDSEPSIIDFDLEMEGALLSEVDYAQHLKNLQRISRRRAAIVERAILLQLAEAAAERLLGHSDPKED